MPRTPLQVALVAALLVTPACAPPHAGSSAPAATAAGDSDPARTDPDCYQVVFENDRVRVLRYRDAPGKRTHRHHHPNMVLVALSSFDRQLDFPDGTSKHLAIPTGSALWVPEQTHQGSNVGGTPSEAVLVELKR